MNSCLPSVVHKRLRVKDGLKGFPVLDPKKAAHIIKTMATTAHSRAAKHCNLVYYKEFTGYTSL